MKSLMILWLLDLRRVLAFSTRLPLGRGPAEEAPQDMVRSLRLAPLVGAMTGTLLVAVAALALALGLPPLAAALLALFAAFWFGGGLHEDGLADCADGLGAVASRDRRLEIMRDSRLGSFGGTALVMSFGLRAVALAALFAAGDWPAAVLVAHCLSRAFFSALLYCLPPARRDGLAGRLPNPAAGDAILALALGAAAAFTLLPLPAALWAMGLATLVAFLWALLALRRFGGHSGDILGALQQLLEISLLLLFAAQA